MKGGGVEVSYHHHVPSERVGQVRHRGVSVGIGGMTLGAVPWLVAPVDKESRVTKRKAREGVC